LVSTFPPEASKRRNSRAPSDHQNRSRGVRGKLEVQRTRYSNQNLLVNLEYYGQTSSLLLSTFSTNGDGFKNPLETPGRVPAENSEVSMGQAFCSALVTVSSTKLGRRDGENVEILYVLGISTGIRAGSHAGSLDGKACCQTVSGTSCEAANNKSPREACTGQRSECKTFITVDDRPPRAE